LCETAALTHQQRLLPMGLAEGCRLKRAIPRDQVLSYDDVERPAPRLVDDLSNEQDTHFFGAPAAQAAALANA
jgi:predicted homoserine dehydrogenase-like protein